MVKLDAIKSSGLFRVRFSHPAPQGHSVAVAGVFNDWDPCQNPMSYSEADAVYFTEVILAPGEYEYKLVIDGDWLTDDENPNFVSNDFGTLNSIVQVK